MVVRMNPLDGAPIRLFARIDFNTATWQLLTVSCPNYRFRPKYLETGQIRNDEKVGFLSSKQIASLETTIDWPVILTVGTDGVVVVDDDDDDVSFDDGGTV